MAKYFCSFGTSPAEKARWRCWKWSLPTCTNSKRCSSENTFAVYGCKWLSYIWLHVWHRYKRLRFETRNRQTFPYKGCPLNETADVLLPSLNQWGKCQGELSLSQFAQIVDTKLLHKISHLQISPRHKDLREIETANSPVDEGTCAWRACRSSCSSSWEAWESMGARTHGEAPFRLAISWETVKNCNPSQCWESDRVRIC